MRMKMNTSLSGPTVNVAPGGVHVCSPAEAIRHYRAGHGTPTEDSAEEFNSALAEQEAEEAAELYALDADPGNGPGNEGDRGSEPAPVAEPTPAPAKVARAAKADKPQKAGA